MEDTNIPMPFTAEMCSCCRSKQCYKDIKTEYNWMGQKEVYEEMLFSTFNITIYQDGYSIQDAPQICEVCIKRLRDACNLKKQVLECQRTIAEYFNSLQKSGNPMVEIKLELSNEDVAEDETMSDEESEVKRKGDSDAMGEERDDITESCNIDNDLEFSTEIKLNWDKKKTLLFIGKYKEHQILWNPSHPEHFHKVKKNAAWVKLAQDMRITVKECQKKITSLLASLRREKARVRKSALGTGKGAKKVYTSSWFAYKALSFVLNRFTPRVTDNAIRHTEKETPDKNLLLDSNYDAHGEPSLNQVETNLKKVTQKPEDFKKPNLEPQKCFENQSFNLPKDLFTIDECVSYGIFVSNKLKLYSENTRAYVQHNVSNILFNADRGEYEQVHNVYMKGIGLNVP